MYIAFKEHFKGVRLATTIFLLMSRWDWKNKYNSFNEKKIPNEYHIFHIC